MNKIEPSIKDRLASFCGTTRYYQLSSLFPRFYLTDGTAFLCREACCGWLFSDIAAYQLHPTIQNNDELQQIQFWTLTVRADRSAELVCEWDRGKPVFSTDIAVTDFPLSEIVLWVQPYYPDFKVKHWVCHLPSEY
jgi:hypothetical protein